MATATQHLSVYLNDHLAGSVAALGQLDYALLISRAKAQRNTP